jgi:hypothetical protein
MSASMSNVMPLSARAGISPIRAAQTKFLLAGGTYELPLAMLRAAGVLPEEYVFHEYPKMIRLTLGSESVEMKTDTCKGTEIRWTEQREIFEAIVVNSEAEEERVLSGGKTSAQIEDERQGLIMRCHSMGVPVDPAWSAVRLRRELGDALDAPAPGDNVAKLEAELANLRKIAAMQEEIAALKARIAEPANDIEEMAEAGEPGRKRGRGQA